MKTEIEIGKEQGVPCLALHLEEVIVNNLHFVENCLSECVVNGKKKDKLF